MATGSPPQQPDYSLTKPASAPTMDWKPPQPIRVTKPAKPDWNYGDGATDSGRSSLGKKHVEIDPFAPDRRMSDNYTLLISGIVPRPIGFLSTVSVSGDANLAPFSYFQVVDHDPPVFVVGFSPRAGGGNLGAKDTLTNLEQTGECTINAVGEHMMEATNAAALDAPRFVSEWSVAGLHQAPSTTVRPARVQESVFSIEGKVLKIVDYDTSKPSVGGPPGRMAVIEATRFWVREDAVNESGSEIDLEVLRPVGQLGGALYARVTEVFELPRSNWKAAMQSAGERLRRLVSVPEE